jgi:acetylornithine deacetylase
VRIALSWDEEVGCRGIPQMIDRVIPMLGRPDLCIVGEPTSLHVATGHKGKASYRALCRGDVGHSAMAPRFTNALHLGTDLILALRREQKRLACEGDVDPAFDVPFSTIHAGMMRGGTALNMIPEWAEIEFEIRHLVSESPNAILAGIMQGLSSRIEIGSTSRYPGLDADRGHPAIARLLEVMGETEVTKVSFGTEAGYFFQLGIPTVVCGPGDMAQGHQPDEFVSVDDLRRCSLLLERLVQRQVRT